MLAIAADFDRALRRMIRDRKIGKRCGFPRAKKKFVRECSIYCVNQNTRIAVDGRFVTIPKLGRVRLRGAVPPEACPAPRSGGRLLGARIRRDGEGWTIGFQWECERPAPLPETGMTAAVDLGVARLATIYDGTSFLHVAAPRPLKRALRSLKRRQRRLSARRQGSRRRRAQARRLAALHRKIRNRRQEFVHQLTHRLTAKADRIVIEDLHVTGMMANHHLARAVGDAAFGAIRRCLEYKAERRGRKLVLADRFFPSSQVCSGCGELHAEMRKLSQRTLRCACGAVLDRDENAAVNLFRYPEERGNRRARPATRGEKGDQAHGPVPFVEP